MKERQRENVDHHRELYYIRCAFMGSSVSASQLSAPAESDVSVIKRTLNRQYIEHNKHNNNNKTIYQYFSANFIKTQQSWILFSLG